jgi:hypothetical protein
MKRLLFAALLVAVAAVASAGQLRIRNTSNWDIHYLYVSSVNTNQWGPDQLGADNIIPSGGSWTLSGIACGRYDIKVVDEDSDECEIRDVRLCGNETWTITNDNLLRCQGYR